jgi:hypothetical protein
MINDLRQRGFAPAGRMVFKKDGLGWWTRRPW